MNADNAGACLRALAQAGFRYVPDMTEGTVAIWTDTLRDVTVDAGRRAVMGMAKETSDFPTPAEFRAWARRLQREDAEGERHKALTARAGEHAPFKCVCRDVRMVCVDEERDQWAPCGKCNAEAHRRWAEGAYDTKVFRAQVDRVDLDAARIELEKVRAVLRSES